jgi:hypothetical protein
MSAPGYAGPGQAAGAPFRPAPGTGPAVLAGELLGQLRVEWQVVGELGERKQVLVSTGLTGLRSARTRRAYAGVVTA